MTNVHVFNGGDDGDWAVESIRRVTGETLSPVARLQVTQGEAPNAAWRLRGFTSNIRYATTDEITGLRAIQPPTGRAEAICAALIPIRKSAAWWDLAQDRRRAIFEETSHHNRIGMDYLPQVARRLHHCRDLDEKFDFLTWFEFAPELPPHSMRCWCVCAQPRNGPMWSARSISGSGVWPHSRQETGGVQSNETWKVLRSMT